jgi:hypothetical protein
VRPYDEVLFLSGKGVGGAKKESRRCEKGELAVRKIDVEKRRLIHYNSIIMFP